VTNFAGADWRILLVEDDEELARSTAETLRRRPVNSQDEKATVDVVKRFEEALSQIEERRYDVIILDIRDEEAVDGSGNIDLGQDVTPADKGLQLYDQIRALRYVPIVFFSAVAHLAQDLHDPPFVAVVSKLEEEDNTLRSKVIEVFDSPLPRLNRALARHVDRVLLTFMIDFVEKNWSDLSDPARTDDLAYLLARRLAHSLGAGRIDDLGAAPPPDVTDGKVHPTRLYVTPPTGEFTTGDLLRTADGEWLILLTPSCDLVPREKRRPNQAPALEPNADFVVLAHCQHLIDTDEYRQWLEAGRPGSAKDRRTEKLDKLISNNRQGQKDRYYFLPSAWGLPDLVVDLQRLTHRPYSDLVDFERLATLDDPYAQSLVAQLGRFIGRMGTPDLDVAAVRSKLLDLLPEQAEPDVISLAAGDVELSTDVDKADPRHGQSSQPEAT
jgi:CheY-like chemotaxis protein